jgi:hypothetical protein
MAPLPPPLALFLLMFSGWINQHQQAIIEYLLEENRVLRAAPVLDAYALPTTSDAVSR